MCYNGSTIKISLFKSKRFKEGRCNIKILGGLAWAKGSSVFFSDQRMTQGRFSHINGAQGPSGNPGGTRDISSSMLTAKKGRKAKVKIGGHFPKHPRELFHFLSFFFYVHILLPTIMVP